MLFQKPVNQNVSEELFSYGREAAVRLLDKIFCSTFERIIIIIITIGRDVQVLTFSNIDPMFAVTNRTRVEDSQAMLDWNGREIDNHTIYITMARQLGDQSSTGRPFPTTERLRLTGKTTLRPVHMLARGRVISLP